MRVLVIGSSKGIGLEFCRQLKAKGYEVTATCRNKNSILEDAADHFIENVDLLAPGVIDHLKGKLAGKKFNLVIHNAGILENSQNLNLEELEKQFKVNAAMPILIAQSINDRFANECKVAFITSRMGSIEDNTSGGYYGYRMSKTALNMGIKSLSKDLGHHEQWTFLAIHPGYVKTDMTGNQGTSTPEKSVKLMLQTIEKAGPEATGHFFHAEGQELPW